MATRAASWRRIESRSPRSSSSSGPPSGAVPTDLAGPLCFAGDYLEKGLELPALQEGDEMLLLGTGSNAYALWSRHTSRTIPAMYGVDFKQGRVEELSPRFNPFL